MSWNAAYALLLLSATVVTYVGGMIIQSLKDRGAIFGQKITLAICLTINLGVLCVFKYLGMLVSCLNRVLSMIHFPELAMNWNIILPVGISFFTLQSIGYLIDVYREEISAEKNIVTYALFVSFFPQLVAGPIERSKNLLIQLKKQVSFRYEYFQKGLFWILYGLMIKMVIADNLAVFVDLVFTDPATYAGWYIIAATFAFAIQIYCDFYGYSIIAKGSAYLLGIELMSNFEAPYFSRSVKEFWRRWHISLSTWFRDYVYIPLGGSKRGEVRRNTNLLIVFLVSGLWHGASIAFVFWGMLNGVYQVIGNTFSRIVKHENKIMLFCRRFFKPLFTFCLIAFTWIPFRAGSWSETKKIISCMISGISKYGVIKLMNIQSFWDTMPIKTVNGVILGIMILGVVDFMKHKNISVIDGLVKQGIWFRYIVIVFLVLFILSFGCYGESYNPAQFIYFQF